MPHRQIHLIVAMNLGEILLVPMASLRRIGRDEGTMTDLERIDGLFVGQLDEREMRLGLTGATNNE